MPPKRVALVAAASIMIGWLLASTLSPPIARVQSLPERTPAVATEEQPTFATQLHDRLRQVPDPPASRRNPFAFGAASPERRRNAAPAVQNALPRAEVVNTPAPRGPSYFLAGIGIAAGNRTAVLSDGHAVRIVTLNDAVEGYTVVEISDDAVTLASMSGERHVLRLR